ncbi:hypothetical protein Salat_2653100 [Sesamum alatum]|uniref:Zinc knuckle CX2CX4HX4C domain-containing protein n=1 Tax=Sesamum alatum TaxID=300844 RepID=A0AAE2CAY6_9LAMI|nr:hypothetical protein Salat_2653100 [Sesamum alatum]
MLNPVKGMELPQIGGGRFPWSFEKNIFILNGIRENENPLQVDLDWCDFHVHVHELPLSMMNLGVAMLISNRIGRFRDIDMDVTGCAWGATLRLRVAINVTRPLLRALPISSTLGDELLVHLTYERLLNFSYLCGKLGHIAKYCELQFEEGFVDPGQDSLHGPWLQAPLSARTGVPEGFVQGVGVDSKVGSDNSLMEHEGMAPGAATSPEAMVQHPAAKDLGIEDSTECVLSTIPETSPTPLHCSGTI